MTKKKKKPINKSKNKSKKVLDGFQEVKKKNDDSFNKNTKEKPKDKVNKELKIDKQKDIEIKEVSNIHEKIQSFISILFTIIIFILLLFLILVIYNNYLKPKKEIDVEKVCQDYIKKDYHINEEYIKNYIKENRSIIYNLSNFNRNNLLNDNLLTIAKFIIWDNSEDYILCQEDDEMCLVTKKEITKDELTNKIKSFLKIEEVELDFSINQDENIRIYQDNDNVVLTFNEFEFETLKHEIVDILIDEDIITVYFALSERVPNSNYYNYIGSKKMILKYQDNSYILEKIISTEK